MTQDIEFGPAIEVNGKRPGWLKDEVLRKRVLSKVANLNGKGCWPWTGHKNTKGYGRYQFTGGKAFGAHRIVFALFNGFLPEMDLDHLCRNRACVNPSHLEPVTSRENTLRWIGLSAQNAQKQQCLRGHPLSGENLRVKVGRNGMPERHCRRCQADRQKVYKDKIRSSRAIEWAMEKGR